MTYKLYIVEDDAGIADSIKKYAESWQFSVKCCEDFSNVIAEFSEFEPHLVLLDISLPFYNGYHWCGEIRKVSKTPIIFISSASDGMNIIMAMNMGGDDFIAKPFDISVLMAKIQAVLRRLYDWAPDSRVICHKGALLNTADNCLVWKDEKIPLTKNEYRILFSLMEQKGKIVSRERLMEKLWETDSYVDENTLSVNVGRLRKKLDAAGLKNFITTKFGVGYIIE